MLIYLFQIFEINNSNMSKKVKKILSDDFGQDVGSIIEGYDERCDSDYDQCGNSTNDGERCMYQAVYRKDVDNPNAVMSCKHYCRQHCEDSFKKIFNDIPRHLNVKIDGKTEKFLITPDEEETSVTMELEAGDGNIILYSKIHVGAGYSKHIISPNIDETQIIRRDTKRLFNTNFSFCETLKEYDNVKIKVTITVPIPRDTQTFELLNFSWRGRTIDRWISNSSAWLNSIVTLSNGDKKGSCSLLYNISHRDKKKECYIFKPFKLEIVEDEDEDPNMINDIIEENNYNGNRSVRLIYDLDNLLNSKKRYDKDIIRNNVQKLKTKIKEVYDTMTDEYDKNRLENRYFNVFNESMNISDESKVYDLIQRLRKEFPEQFENVYFGTTVVSAKKAIGKVYKLLQKEERGISYEYRISDKIEDIYKEVFGTQLIVDIAREEHKDYIDEEEEIQEFKEEYKKKNPKKPWAYKTERQRREEKERDEEILSLEDYDPYNDDSEKYRETSDSNDIGEVD